MDETLQRFANALGATFLAGGVATTLGALPVLFLHELRKRTHNMLLSFAAGVMLAATFFSLLLPALGMAKAAGNPTAIAALKIIISLLIGGAFLLALQKYIPHEHFQKGAEGGSEAHELKRIWLLVAAITIHNFPEGLSVGVAVASGNVVAGLGTTVGIGLQNIPEGLSVAIALASQGYSKRYSLGVAALTGLVEVFGGLVGASVLSISTQLVPWSLAFAAGSMLFVVSAEIIPETHRHGTEDRATSALFIGFCVMMFLDAVFAAG